MPILTGAPVVREGYVALATSQGLPFPHRAAFAKWRWGAPGLANRSSDPAYGVAGWEVPDAPELP